MILYQLTCSDGHEFEAWFRDAAGYDEQCEAGAVECPLCGDTDVRKALMAPNLSPASKRDVPAEVRARQVARHILDAVDKISRHVEESCDYVGTDFAEEARRIHHGEADERGIYGEASDEESNELDDEGIEHQRIPWIPRRDN
jgi:hypothetical protein